MAAKTQYSMARTRALLTETERRHIAREGSDQQRYEAVSRARRRINEELVTDVELLAEEHPQLLSELRGVVCENDQEGVQ